VKTYTLTFKNYTGDVPPPPPFVYLDGEAEVEAQTLIQAVAMVAQVLGTIAQVTAIKEQE